MIIDLTQKFKLPSKLTFNFPNKFCSKVAEVEQTIDGLQSIGYTVTRLIVGSYSDINWAAGIDTDSRGIVREGFGKVDAAIMHSQFALEYS